MKVLSGLLLSIISLSAAAQDAHEGTVRFKKEDRPGVLATYDAPRNVTEDALEEKLKQNSLGKQRTERGYWKYEGVTWPEISANKIDVYFDVNRRKGKSVIAMMVSPGNGNFATATTDPQIVEGMKAFLTRFNDDLIAYQQKLAVDAQQKEVAAANRELKHAERQARKAERRQKKADREKERQQKKAADEQQKLNSLQGGQ